MGACDLPLKRLRRRRPTSRAEFMAREKADWSALAATWCGLEETLLLAPGVHHSAWSFKDVWNHLAAWLEAGARVVPALLAGQHATLGHSVHRFNAETYAASQTLDMATSKRRINAARRAMLAALAHAPEERLLDVHDRLGWWAAYTTYAHYGEHLTPMQAHRQRLTEKETA